MLLQAEQALLARMRDVMHAQGYHHGCYLPPSQPVLLLLAEIYTRLGVAHEEGWHIPEANAFFMRAIDQFDHHGASTFYFLRVG